MVERGADVNDESTPLAGPAEPTRSRMPISSVVLIVVILASLAASTAWRLAGNSLYFVATPSMCPSLCVGALVVDVPPNGRALHVGEVISFHPPGISQVFTHRIVEISEHGLAISTKGDAVPKRDSWTITPTDIEGVVVASAWGAGWLLRVLPFMSVGAVIILFTRRLIARRSRRDTDRLFSVLLIALPIAIMKPLLGNYTVSTTSSVKKGVDLVRVINTGLLPAKFQVPGGSQVAHVAPGQSVTLSGPFVAGKGVPLHQTMSLYATGWVVAALVVALPMFSYGYDVLRRHYHVSDHETAPSSDEAQVIPSFIIEAASSDSFVSTSADDAAMRAEFAARSARHTRSLFGPTKRAPRAPIALKGGFRD